MSHPNPYHDESLVAIHRVMPSRSPSQVDPRHAALRRELAAKPERRSARRGKTPCYEQQMPAVIERPLDIYEELACACV